MKYGVYGILNFVLLFLLFFNFSCNDKTNTVIPKEPCVQTGMYCKGNSIYLCTNDLNGEAKEVLIEKCDNGLVCYNEECIADTCDEVVECIEGEFRCNDDKSYKICGNFDPDLCLEWKIIDCGDGEVCKRGKCVKENTVNPCDNKECEANSHCVTGEDNQAECVCDEGYALNENNECVKECIPKACNELNAECGSVDDGCGGVLNCGVCDNGMTCDTTENKCVEDCVPKNCNEVNAECGSIDDGCGGTLNCGRCSQRDTCIDNTCVGPCYENPCDMPHKTKCVETAIGYKCECDEGYHLEGDICVVNDSCYDVNCNDDMHCENGSCVSNTKMVNCKEEIPQHGVRDFENEQVEIIWSNGEWSEPAVCSWHCDTGYVKEDNLCVELTCEDDEHLENGQCVSNTKEVLCKDNQNLINAHNVRVNVTVTWNEETNSWNEPEYCEWECNDDYHKQVDENQGIEYCVTNFQLGSCLHNENLPDNSIEHTDEQVNWVWIVDEEHPDGYWYVPYCEWECDTVVSCLSSDGTKCISKMNTDPCDGEDNDCNNVIDDKNGEGESSSCNNGTCFTRFYGEHEYKFCYALTKNWGEAQALCASEGGYLVSINDEDENDFIKHNLISDSYWIGYYQLNDSGSAPWYWTDSSNNGYTNWADGEPNNSCVKRDFLLRCKRRENCTEVYSNGEWNDNDCKKSRRFICEFNLSH